MMQAKNEKTEEKQYPGWMAILAMIWAVAGFFMIMCLPVYFYMMSAMPLSLIFSIMGVQKKRRYRKLAYAALTVACVDLLLLIVGMLLQLGYGAA